MKSRKREKHTGKRGGNELWAGRKGNGVAEVGVEQEKDSRKGPEV